jgi:uncharacterized membrane protein YfcA
MTGAEIAELVLLLGLGGLAVGYLSGLLGIGGGGILVPVLYDLFRIIEAPEEARMHMAVGTSLAVIAPTSLLSVRMHWRRGTVDLDVLRSVAPGVLAGVLLGVVIAGQVNGSVLKAVFILFCAVMAARLLAGGESWRLGPVLPGRPARLCLGFVTGLVSALNGVGGGAFITSFMTLYGRPMLQSVATAAGVGPLIALPGALGYVAAGHGVLDLPAFSLGFVSLAGMALMVPATLLAAPLGVRHAHRVSRRTLELAFAAFLSIAGLRLTASLLL